MGLVYFSAYTIAKYGMSMCVLGMAEELKPDGIAVNALWPRTGMYVCCCFMGIHVLTASIFCILRVCRTECY